MKKYLLFFTITLGGCSLLDGVLAKEYTLPDIAGKAIPSALAGKTLVGDRSAVRFADGYVAFKSDNSFDTYAARILELGPSTDPHRMFLTDGSTDKGHYRYIAFYITNGGNNIYGFVTKKVDTTNSFPPFHDPNVFDPQDNAMNNPEWAVDEAHKPAALEAPWQGEYISTSPAQPDGSLPYYKITATGIRSGSRGGSRPYENSTEDRILRRQMSGSDLEIYTGQTAYKIAPGGELYRHMGSSPGFNPGANASFSSSPDYKK